MGKLSVERRSQEAANFIAGDYPIVTDAGTAEGDIKQYVPVVIEEEKVKAATSETINNVIGIAAEEAANGEEVVFYLTGEYFADALVLPSDVTVAALKPVLRKLGIFLK